MSLKGHDCVNMDIQIHTISKRRYCINITEIHTFTETAQAVTRMMVIVEGWKQVFETPKQRFLGGAFVLKRVG